MSTLPEGKYLDLSRGMRLHYHDLGAATAPAVVFLQGSGPGASGWSNFQLNVPAFREAGFRVLVPDLPGFGFSGKPRDAQYTLDYFVGYVIEMLDALGIARCALVGNSLGGAVALGLALATPARVSQLVLMAPGGLEPRERYFAMPAMTLMREVFSGGVDREALARFIRTGLVHDGAKVDEAMLAQRWEVYRQQNDQVMKTMVVPDMSARLGEIACPVLVFWGIDEKMMPESGIMALAKGLADVRVVLVSRCGHWVMVEHPRLFNRTAIDFLSGETRDAAAPDHQPEREAR